MEVNISRPATDEMAVTNDDVNMKHRSFLISTFQLKTSNYLNSKLRVDRITEEKLQMSVESTTEWWQHGENTLLLCNCEQQ